MQVKLNNIGIIADSTIEMSGLTIITGHNNSGKTTLGKALYAIVSAVEELQAHALEDKRSYAFNQVRMVLRRFEGGFLGSQSEQVSEEFPYCNAFLENPFGLGESLPELYAAMAHVADEVGKLSLDHLHQAEDWRALEDDLNLEEQEKLFLEQKADVMKVLKRVEESLKADPELIDYATARINKNLLVEFNQQVLPVSNPEAMGEIVVSDENSRWYYHLKIKDNNVMVGEKTYFSSIYEKVVFLDDVYILDSVGNGYRNAGYRRVPLGLLREPDFSDNILGQDHDQHLLMKLRKKQTNLFEELVYAQNTKAILDKIDRAFPDTVTVRNGRYVCAESKLDVRNLATGSKMFALIKMLLERGEIDDHTLLILDEPESHLHPEWQNYFAEVIVLLVQFVQADVLLTTHSPNFLMAIEMYAKKYKIWNKTNIYDTERIEKSDMVKYKNVREDMRNVYSKLAVPLFTIQEELQRLEE